MTPPTSHETSNSNVEGTSEETGTYRDPQGLDFGNGSQKTYAVSEDSFIGEWLGSLLSGSYGESERSSDIIQLLAEDTSVDDPISAVSDAFDRLAQHLTIAIRTTQGDTSEQKMAQALGVTWESQTIVRVRWAWLSLPCALLAATLLFFGITVAGTSKARLDIWKSSALALLFHGLEDPSSGGAECPNHVTEMKEQARKMRVRFENEGDCLKLVEEYG